MAKQEYELPDDDTIKDVQLYGRLQREAQAREDVAALERRERERAAIHPQPAPEPRYVNGRWVMA